MQNSSLAKLSLSPVRVLDKNLGSAEIGSSPRTALFPFAVALPKSPLCKDSEESSSPAAVVGYGSLLAVRQLSPVSIPDSPESTMHAKSARKPSPTMGLIRRGIFRLRAVSPPPSLSSQGGKISQSKADENTTPTNGSPLPVVKGNSSHSYWAVELGRSLSQPSSAPLIVSKSQLGYSRRVKEKVAKQLNKIKELLAEAVVDTPVDEVEGTSKTVLDAMNSSRCGDVLGRGRQKAFGPFFCFDKREPFVDGSAPKVKGMRELKN